MGKKGRKWLYDAKANRKKLDEMERQWKEIFGDRYRFPMGPDTDLMLVEKCIKARSYQPIEDQIEKDFRAGRII